MNVKDFEYIVAIGRNLGISKAAQELFISQPALSKFLSRIEQESDVKLFQHTGKSLVPTLAGEYCIEKAMEILHLNEQISNRINDIAKLKTGRIRIGLPMSRTEYFLARILPVFYRKYPGIQIIIIENATSHLIQKVGNGELDLIFINYSEHDMQTYLHYEKMLEEEMVLAAPTSFKLEHKAFTLDGYRYPCLKTADWKELPYIMLSHDQASQTFANHYFGQNQIVPHIVLEIRNLAQAINAVHHGIGITITPSILFEEKSNISYFSLPSVDGAMLRKTALVYRKDTYLSQAEQDFIQMIKSSFS